MASPAEILRQYLIDVGVLVSQEAPDPDKWPSVIGTMPQGDSGTTPDNYVTIADTGRTQRGRVLSDGVRMGEWNSQVMVRALSYPEGYAKAEEIQATFDLIGVPTNQGGAGFVPVNIGVENYVLKLVHVLVPVTPIGREEQSDRQLFTLNVKLDYEIVNELTVGRLYPSAAPDLDDTVVGYHNGWLSQFTIQTLLDLQNTSDYARLSSSNTFAQSQTFSNGIKTASIQFPAGPGVTQANVAVSPEDTWDLTHGTSVLSIHNDSNLIFNGDIIARLGFFGPGAGSLKIIYTSQLENFIDDFDLAAYEAGAPVGPPSLGGCGTDNSGVIQTALTGGNLRWINDRQTMIDNIILDSQTIVEGLTMSLANGIFRRGSPNSGLHIFTNRNWVTGPTTPTDHDIYFVNLYIDGNRRNYGSGWTGTVTPPNPDTLNYTRLVNDNSEIIVTIAMYGVTNVGVDVRLHDTPSFGVHLANVTTAGICVRKTQPVGDVVPGNDAVHLNGWCQGVLATGCTGRVNDDYFAVNPAEGTDAPGHSTGAIKLMPGSSLAGPCSDITFRDSQGIIATSLCRFLSISAANYVKKATVANCSATVLARGIFFDTFGAPSDDNGLYDDITLRDNKIVADPANGGYGAIELGYCNVGTVIVDNLRVEGPMLALRTINPSKAFKVKMTNTVYAGTLALPFSIETPGIKHLEIDAVHNPAAFVVGKAIKVVGSVGRLDVSGLYENVANVVSIEGAGVGDLVLHNLTHLNSRGGAVAASDTLVPHVVLSALNCNLPLAHNFPATVIETDQSGRYRDLVFLDRFAGAVNTEIVAHDPVLWPNNVGHRIAGPGIYLTGDNFLYGGAPSDTVQFAATQPTTSVFAFEFDVRNLGTLVGGQGIGVILFGQIGMTDFIGLWIEADQAFRLKQNFALAAIASGIFPGAAPWRIRGWAIDRGATKVVWAEYTIDGRYWLQLFNPTTISCAAPPFVGYYTEGVSTGHPWTAATGIQVGPIAVFSADRVITSPGAMFLDSAGPVTFRNNGIAVASVGASGATVNGTVTATGVVAPSTGGQIFTITANGITMMQFTGVGNLLQVNTGESTWNLSKFRLGSGTVFGWSSNSVPTGAANDTEMARAAPGVIKLTNGGSGPGTLSSPALSPTVLSADQDNYNPGTARYLRLATNGAGARAITGLVAGVDGEERIILNVSASDTITLKHQTTSTAANRFLNSTGADIVLAANGRADLMYDGTTARWRVK